MEPRKGPDAMEVEWQGQVNVGATTMLLACLPVGMLIEKMSDRLLSTLFFVIFSKHASRPSVYDASGKRVGGGCPGMNPWHDGWKLHRLKG